MVFTLVLACISPLPAQDNSVAPLAGVPDDWTHHHVVFSDPGTLSQAAVQGKLGEWLRLSNEPRFRIQQAKRLMMEMRNPAPDFASLAARLSHQGSQEEQFGEKGVGPASWRRVRNEGAWSMVTGGFESQTGTVSGTVSTATGQTIVITNGATSLTLTATPTAATATGTFTGEPNTLQETTITNGTLSITLSAATSGTGVCTTGATSRSGSFSRSSTASTDAANLISLINSSNCGGFVGVTAGGTGASVTLTANTAGTAGNSISLSETMSNFSWSGSSLSGGIASTQSGQDFETNSTAATEATNIADAINVSGNGSSVGVAAVANTPSSGEITLTAKTAGTQSITLSEAVNNFSWTANSLTGGAAPTYTPDIFPAKYSFTTPTTAGNCDSAATPDYVVYPTGLTGSSTQPNIIAYDNIYSSCSTSSVPFPNVYWQFNTGGLVSTSPVLSLDGKQVAFVQLSGGVAQLVLLKWSEDSALQSPAVETAAANYNSCTGPCYYAITFSATAKFNGGTGGTSTPSTPTDTYSSPFYDYTNDAIYVGEDNGYLHKFSPVFKSAPAEVTSSWPVQVAVAPLNSPVEDEANGLVFEGGAVFASDSSAFYHSIPIAGGSATAHKTSLAETGTDGNPMFFDGAVLDSSSQTLYTFVNDDGAGTPSAAVWQLNETFSSVVEAKIGQGGYAAGDPTYSGTFDNIYETTGKGNLYVCGRASGSQEPELWKVNINGTTLTPTAIDALTTATAQCSPVTEFENGSTDYIFLSVTGSSNTSSPVSCPSNSTGCLMSFNVSTALSAGASTSSRTSVAGGTGGIVIDNQSSTTGNSQIYFFPLAATSCAGNSNASAGVGTGLCAYQLSQSGLN
jgi:hypothetical protein